MNNLRDGVHVALITPFSSTGIYLPEVMERVIGRTSSWVDGFSVLGSTGEGPLLPPRLKEEVVIHVVGVIKGQHPISCGIAALSTMQCIEECQRLARLGVDAGLVLPPFYYPLQPHEVSGFYRAVADESPIPIVIYHIPQFTKVTIPTQVVGELAQHPNIVGMKDSSMDYAYFQRVRQQAPLPFKLYTGSDDMLMAATRAGGNGTICASANVAPEFVASLWKALRENDDDSAWTIQQKIVTLVDACRELGAGRAWKAAVELLGQGEAKPMAPLEPLNNERMGRLKQALIRVGVL